MHSTLDPQAEAAAPSSGVEATQPPAGDTKPIVFISHKHTDYEIADVVARFVRSATAGMVDVFQSSDHQGGLTLGDPLNPTLAQKLHQAEVVLSLLVGEPSDVAYLMWEAGVATNPDPEGRGTKVVVLGDTAVIPGPVANTARVDLRNDRSVRGFVNQFLTKDNMFPSRNSAITGHLSDSDEIRRLAEELSRELQGLLAPEADTSWEAWPTATFSLSSTALNKVEELTRAGSEEEIYLEILRQVAVLDASSDFLSMLGLAHMEPNAMLHQIVDFDPATEVQVSSPWLRDVAKQIARAACNRKTTPDWAWVVSEDDDRRHSPVLIQTFIRRRISQQHFVFCFPRLPRESDT